MQAQALPTFSSARYWKPYGNPIDSRGATLVLQPEQNNNDVAQSLSLYHISISYYSRLCNQNLFWTVAVGWYDV